MNFEDERLAGLEGNQLGLLLEEYGRCVPDAGRLGTVLWCFDEIQDVPGRERFVRRLLDSKSAEVIVAGSSAAPGFPRRSRTRESQFLPTPRSSPAQNAIAWSMLFCNGSRPAVFRKRKGSMPPRAGNSYAITRTWPYCAMWSSVTVSPTSQGFAGSCGISWPMPQALSALRNSTVPSRAKESPFRATPSTACSLIWRTASSYARCGWKRTRSANAWSTRARSIR
ncbi:MAG: AAA family ATPase [Pseudomonadota bacterium]